jgi:hypothetical protein
MKIFETVSKIIVLSISEPGFGRMSRLGGKLKSLQ